MSAVDNNYSVRPWCEIFTSHVMHWDVFTLQFRVESTVAATVLYLLYLHWSLIASTLQIHVKLLFETTIQYNSMPRSDRVDELKSALCETLMRLPASHNMRWTYYGTIVDDSGSTLVGQWDTQLRTFALQIFTVASTAFIGATAFTSYRYRELSAKISLIITMDFTQEFGTTKLGDSPKTHTYTSCIQDFLPQRHNKSARTACYQLLPEYCRYMKTKTWKPASYAHASKHYPSKRRLHWLFRQFYEVLLPL